MESVLPFANIVARDARSTVQSLNAEPQSWGTGGGGRGAGKAKSQSCESLWDQDSRSCLYNGRIAPWEARMSLYETQSKSVFRIKVNVKNTKNPNNDI